MSQNQIVRGRATKIVERSWGTVVYYHGAAVVVIERGNGAVLNTYGWRSATTKLRMNQAANQFGLGFQVVQRAGQWFVETETQPFVQPFREGMLIPVGGGERL